MTAAGWQAISVWRSTFSSSPLRSVLPVPQRVRRPAQRERVPGVSRLSRHPAGAERRGGAEGVRAGAFPGLRAEPAHRVRAQELLLPDLPKNYQISQYGAPVGRAGSFCSELDGRRETVGIREVHLEEDAGKMIHAGDVSLLDYNRTGTPLVEVVTQPDLEGAGEAEQFLEQFPAPGALPEGVRRQHGAGIAALRRQRIGEPSRRRTREQGGDQEPQLLQVRAQRPRLRDQAPERAACPRRAGEGGDAAVEREPRLHRAMRVKESEDDYRYFHGAGPAPVPPR